MLVLVINNSFTCSVCISLKMGLAWAACRAHNNIVRLFKLVAYWLYHLFFIFYVLLNMI